MDGGTAALTAGTVGRLHAPLAITSVRHRQSPPSVATW